MKDQDKTKAQLIKELAGLRCQNAELIQSNNSLMYILATLVDNLSEGIIVTDLNGHIIYINKSIEQNTGYARNELLGRSPVILNGEGDADAIQQDITTTMQRTERWCGEVLQKRKDGSTYLAEFEILPVLDDQCTPIAWASIQRDITRRKQVEKALELSETKYRTLVEQIPAITYTALPDKTSTALYISPQIEKLLGFSPSEYLADRDIWLRQIHPEDRERVLSDLLSCHTNNGRFVSEYRMYARNGSVVWFYDEADIIRDDSGKPLYLHGVKFDITERKRSEEKLRLSEERFYKAFNFSPNPMAISSLEDGRFIEVNDSFLDITGYSREEIIGNTATKFNIWEPKKRAEAINQLIEQGHLHNFENSFISKSGKVRIGLFSAEIIEINGEKLMLSVMNDITDLRLFQKEMSRLDKLNLIGELAAGIGHEIRNPMTTVRGFLQILEGKEECVKYKEYYDLMIEELDRANAIITEFLSLAKNKAVDFRTHNLNKILKAIFPLIQADAMRADKFVKLDLGSISDSFLDEKEIRQLILNLVRNGLEAMSPGGMLNIRTFMDGDNIVLAIEDQGVEIDPHVLDQIGTPFFTTKDNGTGLGLAVCYSIAKRHNAKIEIKTGPTGTTFYVRF